MKRWISVRHILALLGAWLVSSTAFAGGVGAALSGAGGGSMPWDKAIGTMRGSVTGTVGPALLVVACVIAGAAVAKSGDLGAFGRQVFTIILGGGFIIGAASFIGMFSSGGLVP